MKEFFPVLFFFFVTQNTINICKIMFLTKKKKKLKKIKTYHMSSINIPIYIF